MYRQCDLQKEDKVIRAWIKESNAVEGNCITVGNQYPGLWAVIRTHGYSPSNYGIEELKSNYRKFNS